MLQTSDQAPASSRRRQIVTPHTKSLIYQSCGRTHHWKGTRRGVKIQIQVTDQPDLNQNRVVWSAIVGTLHAGNRRIHRGKAQDIHAAIEEIEHAAARPNA
jgi:hypothetical protein